MANIDTLKLRKRRAQLERARSLSLQSRAEPCDDLRALRARIRGPRKLRQKHMDIARRMLLGEAPSAIARAMGLKQDQMQAIVHAPVFRHYLDDLQKQLDARAVENAAEPQRLLAAEQVRSIQAILQIRDTAESDAIKLQAARAILQEGRSASGAEGSAGGTISGDVATSIAVALKDVAIYIAHRQKQAAS